jgi:tetratricopeptide (TPR) repeat protein
MRLGIVRSNQAEISGMQGDLHRAIEHAEESVALARQVGDADNLAASLHTLGRLMQRTNDPERARHVFGECLVLARDLGYREVLANCVQAAAERLLSGDGDPEVAARFQTVARQAMKDMGVRPQGLEGQSFDHADEVLAKRLDPERLRAIEQAAADLGLESALDDALAALQPERSPT